MSNFTHRPARETDSRPIKDLIHLVGINPTGLDWKRFVVVVNAQDQVIACGQLKPHGADVEILELASLAVQPEFQGQGLGRLIIEYLLKKSPRPLYLMCMSKNGGLYEKFGFHALEYKDMPRYFQRISKLAGFADIFIHSGEALLVMKLE
jgi:N-acetylglutamate synthase-like GNAT family acetyltransferase